MKGVRLRNHGGFTLLEAVVVVSLLGLVGLSFAFLFSTAQKFMIQSMNATSSQGDAAFALEHIKRHLETATIVTEPAAGASRNALEFTWQRTAAVAAQTSRYEIDVEVVNGVPVPVLEFDGEVVSRGITAITFTRGAAGTPAAGTVSIDVTAERTSGGDTRQMRLQTNVSPRGLLQ